MNRHTHCIQIIRKSKRRGRNGHSLGAIVARFNLKFSKRASFEGLTKRIFEIIANPTLN